MKKICISVISLITIIWGNGCLGTSSRKNEPEPPRREFQSIESIDTSSKIPFVVNDFISDNISYKKGAVYFSTALFLSDLGILENTTKEDFKKYAEILFSGFPSEGQVKEIIIPNLSLSQDIEHEKNAYLFVTKNKNSDGKDFYLIESNIPMASIYAKTYNGYVISLNGGFFKNEIPARWTSIMNISINNDLILYKGIAYPSKSAPLIFTGTGIGSDVRMNSITSGESTVFEVKNGLKETVEQTLTTTKSENQLQIDSIKFLEKFTNISLSAYSYIDEDIEAAIEYQLLSKEIEVNIPDDIMGSRYNELEKIVNYLISIIEQ
jgi:hypothetical protein